MEEILGGLLDERLRHIPAQAYRCHVINVRVGVHRFPQRELERNPQNAQARRRKCQWLRGSRSGRAERDDRYPAEVWTGPSDRREPSGRLSTHELLAHEHHWINGNQSVRNIGKDENGQFNLSLLGTWHSLQPFLACRIACQLVVQADPFGIDTKPFGRVRDHFGKLFLILEPGPGVQPDCLAILYLISFPAAEGLPVSEFE